MTGYIKLHRQILEWEWYSDINTKILFLHILLKSNFKDSVWRGIKINRGQLFTSIFHLSSEIGISEKQIRNSLKKLKNTKEIDIQGASNGTMITVCNYEIYQSLEISEGEQTASNWANEGQAKGERRANEGQQRKKNNKDKNDNKEKNTLLSEIKISDLPFKNEKTNELWKKLLKSKKWKNKSEDAINLSIEKLKKFDEEYICELIEKAIIGNYQGIVFSDTEQIYKIWQNGRKTGNDAKAGSAAGTDRNRFEVGKQDYSKKSF